MPSFFSSQRIVRPFVSFKSSLILIALLSASVSSQKVLADQVITGNGDQLTGFISYLDGSKLKLSTSHSGTLTISRTHIQSLILERNVNIRLKDGRELQGKLQSVKDGVTLIETLEGEEIELSALEDVKFLYYLSPINQEFKFSGSVLGEVDLERSESGKESKEWSLTINNSISYSHFRNRSRFEYERDSTNDTTTDKETLFDTSMDYFISGQIFTTARFRYEEDRFENLNKRRVFGAGIGHQPWRAPFRKLLYSAEFVHLDENYQEGADIKEQGVEFRLSYLEETMIDGLYFYHDNTVMFIETGDKRIETTSTLEYALPYNIGITLNYEWDYNDSPESGDGKTYSNLTIGASYRW